MYKILSPLRNNGKFYGIGDRIAESELSQGDRDLLINQKILESEEIFEDTTSNPQPAPVSPNDKDWTTFTGVLSKDMDIVEYVNSVDVKGLERIKGVGASTAKAMVNHKTTSGDFTSVSQLSQLVPSIKWEQIEVTGSK